MVHGLIGLSERKSDFIPDIAYCFNADENHSWPKTMYMDEGRQMGERLWNETLDELKFAEVQEKLRTNPSLERLH